MRENRQKEFLQNITIFCRKRLHLYAIYSILYKVQRGCDNPVECISCEQVVEILWKL